MNARSIRSNHFLTAGKRIATLRNIPGYCDPSPGKTTASSLRSSPATTISSRGGIARRSGNIAVPGLLEHDMGVDAAESERADARTARVAPPVDPRLRLGGDIE